MKVLMEALKRLLKKYDNFIFDLYGTLIYTHTDEWADEVWIKFVKYLEEKSIRVPDYKVFKEDFFNLDIEYRIKGKEYHKYPEIDILEVYEELFIKYGNEVPKDLKDISYKFREISRSFIELMPGAEEFLKFLRDNGKKIYILSNAQASYTLPEIKMLNLDTMVDDYLMSSDYRVMKPDKEFFNILIKRYHMKKRRTLMIGDSPESDIKGAKKAGIKSFQIIEKFTYKILLKSMGD